MKRNGQQVIHVNFSSASVDPVYFPQLEVIGDIGNAIWKIKEKISVQNHWDFSYFMKIKQNLDTHIDRDKDSDAFPMIPQRIVADVRAAMPEDGILTLDNGMYKLWFARHYKAYARNTILLDNALATMGAGLPSAMAASMIYPDRKVATIVGDGGFMMNSQELETAVRLNLNLVVLVLNDSGYGMIKWKQKGMGFENHGLEFGNPDFVKYAESYGAEGYRLESASELKTKLTEFLNKPGVQLIEVPLDYSENHKVLTEELQNIVCPN